MMEVHIYRAKVSGPTDGALPDLMKAGTIKLEPVKTVTLPRRRASGRGGENRRGG